MHVQLKRPSGREQGVLNFTLKMGGVTHARVLSEARRVDDANVAAGMADGESAFAAAGCCVPIPHFYRDDHNFHRGDAGTNVVAH